jgi:regulator of cell morphogenesis and NO signaling
MLSATATPSSPLLDSTVADLLLRRPETRKVLDRYDIDYCCSGHRTLAEVCWEAGVDQEALLDELQATSAGTEATPNWEQMSVVHLVDHIVVHCHRPLQEELPILCKRARAILATDASRTSGPLHDILSALEALLRELIPHMHDEEARLFPWLKQQARHRDVGFSAPPSHLYLLMDEHDHAAGLLRQLRMLTNDYSVPVGMSEKWVELWQGLADLDADLREHIHLENNVLFPRFRGESAT